MQEKIIRIIKERYKPDFCLDSEVKKIDITRMYNWVRARAMRGLGYSCACKMNHDQYRAIEEATAYMVMLANGYDNEIDRERVEKDTLDFMQNMGLLNTRFR